MEDVLLLLLVLPTLPSWLADLTRALGARLPQLAKGRGGCHMHFQTRVRKRISSTLRTAGKGYLQEN